MGVPGSGKSAGAVRLQRGCAFRGVSIIRMMSFPGYMRVYPNFGNTTLGGKGLSGPSNLIPAAFGLDSWFGFLLDHRKVSYSGESGCNLLRRFFLEASRELIKHDSGRF